MKEKYTVKIAGTELRIITDESAERLNELVETLDKKINDMVIANKRCSRLDAAILCALEYLDDKKKIESKMDEFTLDYEIQIEDLKKEIASLKSQINCDKKYN